MVIAGVAVTSTLVAGMSASGASARTFPDKQREAALVDQARQTVTANDVAVDKAAGSHVSDAATLFAPKLPTDSVGLQATAASSPYWVYDHQSDSAYDSFGSQELGDAALAVTKAYPADLLLAVQGMPATQEQLTVNGAVAAFLDTNNDGSPDLVTVTPPVAMQTGSGYSTPVFRVVGNDLVATNVDAVWIRTDEAWAVDLPWKTLGISATSFVMGVNDGTAQGEDYAPEDFGTYVKLAGVVAPPVAQRVSGTVPKSAKAKRGAVTTLPSKTTGGKPIVWKTTTPSVCTVTSNRLVSKGKKGKCQLVATSAADATRSAMRQTYVVVYR